MKVCIEGKVPRNSLFERRLTTSFERCKARAKTWVVRSLLCSGVRIVREAEICQMIQVRRSTPEGEPGEVKAKRELDS